MTAGLSGSSIRRRCGAVTAIFALLCALLAGFAASAPAEATVKLTATSALSGSSFNRADIISDYLFYQSNAMSQAQIQTFLNTECPTNNCINTIKSASTNETSNAECPGGYTGLASETTAAIIYKVQTLCGISAKVILVTLQKEQGLLTAQNPSSGRLRAAMGYACPDTAPCSSSSLGFFRQIYDAAWQFQEYRLNAPTSSVDPVGKVSAIRYSPNAACGSVNIQIANQATRALYIYTPYTPDAAALNNLGGTGDACSSYGNRNFWVYWNNYFGSTQLGAGDDQIAAAYAAAGGSAGPLGAASGASTCATSATSCSQSYANGLIYWSSAGGAIVVEPPINPVYSSTGGLTGALGVPTRNNAAIAASSWPAGSGQLFAAGSIYSSPAGTFAVSGAIRTEYWAKGSNSGTLGWPTAAQVCSGAVCSQTYQGGLIYSPTKTTAYTVTSPIFAAYAAAGGMTGALGVPTRENASIAAAGGWTAGSGQLFAAGSIYTSTAGTFPVSGAIRTEYWAQKSNAGKLGWPTAAPTCAGAVCSQTFQGGQIISPTKTTAFSVIGAYQTVYAATGGITGTLGLPTREDAAIAKSAWPAGSGQLFAKGSIYSSPAGTFAVYGAIRTEYWAQKSNSGKLGWPIAAATCSGAICSQAFQGGEIVAPTATTAFSVIGAYDTVYKAAGGVAGYLGVPTREVAAIAKSTWPAGSGQLFAGGSIYASPAGTFAVSGAIRTAYWAAKSNAGKYGWPIANQTCTATVCTQKFQGGTLTGAAG